MNEKLKIPTHEYKSVIEKKWYPNVPNNVLRKDMISISRKNNNQIRKHYIKSDDICELFMIHGKPTIFDKEDYDQYLKSYLQEK